MHCISKARAILVVAVLTGACAAAQAAPTHLACTFDDKAAGDQRTWTYDLEARTIDGHPVGQKIATVGNAYNQYFISDNLIGFSTSTGVRHAISLANGRYTAYGKDGSVRWTGTCVAAQ